MKPILVDELVPCRKCESCLRNRSRLWAARARDEYNRAARTWMGTFTMSPAEHAVLDIRIAERTGNRVLTAEELMRERTSEFGTEVTKWLKRVRKAAFERTGHTATMRYLLVAEVHDSEETEEWMRGRPHFHMLLHEVFCGALIQGKPVDALLAYDPVKRIGFSEEMLAKEVKRRGKTVIGIFATDQSMIRQAWEFGFTTFELCFDSKSAFYLCKYMSKAMMWRVRPSLGYGRVEQDRNTGAEATDRSGALTSVDPPLTPPSGENVSEKRRDGTDGTDER